MLKKLKQSDYPLEIIEDLGMLFTGLYRSDSGKPRNVRKAVFKCHCGNLFTTTTILVKTKRTKSCGCLVKENTSCITHNASKTQLYKIWKNMRSRCNNNKYYKNIFICKDWDNYAIFKKWALENGYISTNGRNTLSIDRIDNNKNYCPENCRWTNNTIQTQNRRVLNRKNTSGYRGVHFDKRCNHWIARCGFSWDRVYLGIFKTALNAAKAYDTFVIENNLAHNINGVLHEPIKN